MRSRSKTFLVLPILLTIMITGVYTAIINIPEDYSTIQGGIIASPNGDTILVQPGIYVENIDFWGRDVIVGSLTLTTGDTSYISQTVIDGNDNGHVVRFGGGESSSAVLNGFTITNGGNISDGGGIFCTNSSHPTLNNLIVSNNVAGANGGGIFYENPYNVTISNTIIRNNQANDGGGIYIRGWGPINLNNVEIYSNEAADEGGGAYYNLSRVIHSGGIINSNWANYGSGIWILGAPLSLNYLLIANNTSSYGGGGIWSSAVHPNQHEITNCTFAYNISLGQSPSVFRLYDSNIDVKNSIIWGNSTDWLLSQGTTVVLFSFSVVQSTMEGEGNISTDPLFVNSNIVDYHLQPGSPCIDAGDPDLDNDGNTWENDPNDQDPDGTRMDIGVFYFHQIFGCTDPEAINYNPEATTDDGSCVYFTYAVDYSERWNMVGLPLYVFDSHYLTLFPNAATGTLYYYDSVYQSQDSLELGIGYLLFMNASGGVTFSGAPVNELTISLQEGWNIISSISTPVNVSEIYASGLIANGTVYGYSGTYFNPETIDPGKGYWVYAYSAGEITLSGVQLAAKDLKFVNLLEDANSLEFTNGDGYSTKLYFGKNIPEEVRINYSLPPTFPGMLFDTRFISDLSYAENSGEIKVINNSESLSIKYNVVLDAGELMNWVLSDPSTGKEYVINSTGEIKIDSEIGSLILNKKVIIPDLYALHQNYPNPFNPLTTIQYNVPEPSHVTLSIYDLKGRLVRNLINQTEEAGYKSVVWNAQDDFGKPVSAGVYLYEIKAGDFLQTKKLVLLK